MSIKIEKFVACVNDEDIHAAGVVEQAPAELGLIEQLAILQLYSGLEYIN